MFIVWNALDIIYYKTASTFDVVEYLGAGGRQLNTPYEMHAVPLMCHVSYKWLHDLKVFIV